MHDIADFACRLIGEHEIELVDRRLDHGWIAIKLIHFTIDLGNRIIVCMIDACPILPAVLLANLHHRIAILGVRLDSIQRHISRIERAVRPVQRMMFGWIRQLPIRNLNHCRQGRSSLLFSCAVRFARIDRDACSHQQCSTDTKDISHLLYIHLNFLLTYYLTTRAPAPFTTFSTSAFEAIDVSPGVVIANAPWAQP